MFAVRAYFFHNAEITKSSLSFWLKSEKIGHRTFVPKIIFFILKLETYLANAQVNIFYIWIFFLTGLQLDPLPLGSGIEGKQKKVFL